MSPEGAEADWNGANLSARDGQTTVQNSSDPDSNVVHGGGGVLNMTQDGNQHSFDANGPINQSGGGVNDPNARGTHPSLSREGDTSTVEQVYRPRGSSATVDAPTMRRDSAGNRSEVSHDSFRATRDDNGTKVELVDQGVAVTRGDDGGTVVETDSFRLERTPDGSAERSGNRQDNGRRDLTIRPGGDSGIEVTRDADGTVRVKEDGQTVFEQPAGNRSGDGGNRAQPV
ncbi:hypothetical protein, partial [Nocardiopsis kunsanensis]|uniref:hypothetical protein n=1 Tax=Nocardiopsis kunsanensis TaxID=141693 RepID=UPI001876ACAC